MTVRGGARWALIGSGALIVVIVAALIIAPPYVVRYALHRYLNADGVTADIGHVGANIFTGQISLDNVSGHGPDDRRFSIGHLALNLDYWPLTHHHIELQSIQLNQAQVDVGRNAHQQFTIAGVPLPVGGGGGQRHWGLGVGNVAVQNLSVHYRAPAGGDQPAVHQTVGIDRLHIGALATWQPTHTTPAQTRLRVKDGRLDLDGQFRLLGSTRRAKFAIKASSFPMQAFTPLASLSYITKLAGTFDADQQLSIEYGAGGELKLELKGRSSWHHAHAAVVDGTEVHGGDMSWQGDEHAVLWRGGNQPGRISADGELQLSDLAAKRAHQIDFSQKSATWNGKAQAKLGARATRVTTHGKLSAKKTSLASGQWLKLSSAVEHLTGDLDLTLTPDETRIDTNGGFTASAMAFAVPGTIKLNSAALDWDGKTTIRSAGNGPHIQTQGSLRADKIMFDVPATSHVTAGHVDWKGHMAMHSGHLFSRSANGQLDASKVHLTIPRLPIRMTAARFGFDGQYAEQPDNTGKALRLTLSGAAHSHKLDAVDTTIDAPWAELLQTEATHLDIDSLDSIKIGDLKTSGIHLLGDPHGDSPVIQAVSMQVKAFSLQNLLHYHVHDLEFGGANIHTRHDAHGMGVISEFINSMRTGSKTGHGGSGQTSAPKSSASGAGGSAPAHSATSTYAVDHMHVSGPALAFVDTATTPNVNLTAANMDFTLDHLDTAKPDQSASYTLGADVGAYGHFDSRGKIAPFAPDGIHMDLDAWLRSLALSPLSGYLNAAMGRKIANGVADGTLNLSATKGQLNGVLDTTVTNFRLANEHTKETEIGYGLSMNMALKLLRGQNDIIHFRTKILGDVTNPYFSMDNLIREAVLAGVRTALLSNYSPLGLLNKAKNSFLNLFRSVKDRPAIFAAGHHYVRPADRKYLALIAKAMRSHPGWILHIAGQAVPADAKAMKLSGSRAARRTALEQLARQRQQAVSDYLTARNVNPARIIAGDPKVVESDSAQPAVKFSLDKN